MFGKFRKLEKAVAVTGVCSGVLRENSGKVPGKIAGKFFPNREMLQILGCRAPGKANLPGTLGRHCRDLVPTFRAGCFLKSTVPAFSSFSEKYTKNVQKLSRGAENTIFGHFLPIWSMLLFADPVQCPPVTNLVSEVLQERDFMDMMADSYLVLY